MSTPDKSRYRTLTIRIGTRPVAALIRYSDVATSIGYSKSNSALRVEVIAGNVDSYDALNGFRPKPSQPTRSGRLSCIGESCYLETKTRRFG